jgi:hypothetical protein
MNKTKTDHTYAVRRTKKLMVLWHVTSAQYRNKMVKMQTYRSLTKEKYFQEDKK